MAIKSSIIFVFALLVFQGCEKNTEELLKTNYWKIPIDMVCIKKGTIKLGPPENREERFQEGRLNCNLSVYKDYFIQRTEVTQYQWRHVMEMNPSKHKEDSNPVESVSWFDSIVFCNHLSKKEGFSPCYYSDQSYSTVFENKEINLSKNVYWKADADGYRLPTVEEWEYSCRAGSNSGYYWGNSTKEIKKYAWYAGNSAPKGQEVQTHPVSIKKPNGFGLYDMAGNVSEWCWNVFDDPQILEYSSQLQRSVKGGDCFGWESSCKSSFRSGLQPQEKNFFIGFRMARNAE